MATVKDDPATKPMAHSRSLLLAVIAIGLCVTVELFVLSTRSNFGNIATDFEIELPVISTVALSWVLPTFLAAVILIAVIKEFIPALRQVADGCNGIILLIGLAGLAIYVAGVFMPLFSIITGLS